MSRWTVFGMGGMALLAAWATIGASTGAAAGDDEKDKATPKATRRVNVFNIGGGGRLGVSLGEVGHEDLAKLHLGDEHGAVVREVESDSPAASAGIKEGDVIVRYDGEAVKSAAQLARLVRETPGGRKVALEVSRDGAVQRLSVTLSEGSARSMLGGDLGNFNFHFPDPPHPPDLPDFAPMMKNLERLRDNTYVLRGVTGRGGRLGLSYQDLSDQLAKYFKVDGGLLVSSVEEGGPAAQAGIKAGDVIVKFNGKTVHDAGDLHEEMGRTEPGSEATVTVQRDGHVVDLKVKLGGRASATVVRPRATVRPRAGVRL